MEDWIINSWLPPFSAKAKNARLRIKESDRLAAVAEVLTALGANVTEGADSLIIRGKDGLTWRVDPAICGPSGVIADIGTHVEPWRPPDVPLR